MVCIFNGKPVAKTSGFMFTNKDLRNMIVPIFFVDIGLKYR